MQINRLMVVFLRRLPSIRPMAVSFMKAPKVFSIARPSGWRAPRMDMPQESADAAVSHQKRRERTATNAIVIHLAD